jgi:hypothetical protein
MDRARRIAESLELGIAAQNGVMLGKGDRFRVQPVEVQLKGAQPVTTDAANQTSREYSHAD